MDLGRGRKGTAFALIHVLHDVTVGGWGIFNECWLWDLGEEGGIPEPPNMCLASDVAAVHPCQYKKYTVFVLSLTPFLYTRG